ncbi:MAG: sigma-54 dependent transcriptional regulator [Saprospiraceae bacterium]
MITTPVLIIDDDTAVCASLKVMLRRAGLAAESISLPNEALASIERWQPSLVLLDMNFTIDTSGRQGLKLLKAIRASSPQLPVILMTGWATVQLAVEGMKLGASDFVAKPWDNRTLLDAIRTILQQSQNAIQQKTTGFEQIIGQDPALSAIVATAQRIAATQASVLIMGESGTGKELVAEAIHAASKRADMPFVKVNLGGIPETLFESEMFGHTKGAFTDAHSSREGRFGLANGGTIFLDEIGDLPMANQVKLLRVLQEQTFEVLGSSRQQRIDVRVISATNKPLADMVANGTFREDLLYRINLITLSLPPLRERPGDIPLLATHFLQKFEVVYERPGLTLTPAAVEWLRQQPFPGNIRQLKNVVERTVLLSPHTALDASDFAAQSSPTSRGSEQDSQVLNLDALEERAIKRALSLHDNNITAAAQALGITRSALYRRLQKYHIDHAR